MSGYPGPSELIWPPTAERWDDWVKLDSKAWPRRVERRSMLVPTTCFNCGSACGLLAYVDPETLEVPGIEATGSIPARVAQLRQGPGHAEPDQGSRPVHPLRRGGARGEGAGARLVGRGPRRHRRAHPPGDRRRAAERGHVPRRQPGEDGYTEQVLAAWGVDGHNSHEHLLELRPGRLPLLDGARPPEPRPRERGRDPARLGPLESATTSTPSASSTARPGEPG